MSVIQNAKTSFFIFAIVVLLIFVFSNNNFLDFDDVKELNFYKNKGLCFTSVLPIPLLSIPFDSDSWPPNQFSIQILLPIPSIDSSRFFYGIDFRIGIEELELESELGVHCSLGGVF